MKEAERKRKILYHQHLTSRCDAQTAARDVLALQAQFLRHAQMSLRLRTRDDSWKQWVKQSVKTRLSRNAASAGCGRPPADHLGSVEGL